MWLVNVLWFKINNRCTSFLERIITVLWWFFKIINVINNCSVLSLSKGYFEVIVKIFHRCRILFKATCPRWWPFLPTASLLQLFTYLHISDYHNFWHTYDIESLVYKLDFTSEFTSMIKVKIASTDYFEKVYAFLPKSHNFKDFE